MSFAARFVVAAVILMGCLSAPAAGQTPTSSVNGQALLTDRFEYAYVPPKNSAHRPIQDMLKESRVLEKLQMILKPLRLPQRINLKVQGCDGVANATFWNDDVIVCYEYFEFLMKHAPRVTTHGLTPKDALVGPTVDVFLHEVGHAVVELLDIPFFGREEEVADYFATYMLLQFPRDEARRLILGASLISGSEMSEEQGRAPELRLLADTHSLPAQRHFNRLCMAYGSDPAYYGDAVQSGLLPASRAKHCRYEFKTNEHAFMTLIAPYIDETLKRDILARQWFDFESHLPIVIAAAGNVDDLEAHNQSATGAWDGEHAERFGRRARSNFAARLRSIFARVARAAESVADKIEGQNGKEECKPRSHRHPRCVDQDSTSGAGRMFGSMRPTDPQF